MQPVSRSPYGYNAGYNNAQSVGPEAAVSTGRKLVIGEGITLSGEIEACDHLVVEGTVYPLLTRLKNDGLLNYRWEESTSGPPRKYYGLTENGKIFLNELNGTWTELSDAVNIITSGAESKTDKVNQK